MKTTYSAPAWAITLIKEVCSEYDRALPTELHWYSLNIGGGYDKVEVEPGTWRYVPKVRPSSSGNARPNGRIHISAGEDKMDQRLVLLHELAHHIMMKTKKGRQAHHNTVFWKLAFELYERYNVDMKYAQKRETNYRKTAGVVFERYFKEKHEQSTRK